MDGYGGEGHAAAQGLPNTSSFIVLQRIELDRLLREHLFVSGALGQPSHPLTFSYDCVVMSPHFCQSQ